MEIILASKSPRRKQLLEWAEIPFKGFLKETDENYPEGLSAPDVAVYIAKNKALAAKTELILQNQNSFVTPILAADTIVVLNDEVIGKPSDRDDAIRTLEKLSGQHHQVITGVCILYNQKEIIFSETTIVEFYELTAKQIEFYIDKYAPYDKAGAYAIQEWIGVTGIKSIKGDFYNVMGLPISRVVQELSKFEQA